MLSVDVASGAFTLKKWTNSSVIKLGALFRLALLKRFTVSAAMWSGSYAPTGVHVRVCPLSVVTVIVHDGFQFHTLIRTSLLELAGYAWMYLLKALVAVVVPDMSGTSLRLNLT